VPQTIDAKVSESNSHESSSRSRAGPPSAGNSEPAAAPPSADRSSKLVERGKRREGGESAAAPSASEPPKPSVAIVIDEGEGGENTREGGAARAQAYVCCLVLGIMIGTEIGMSLNDSSAIKRAYDWAAAPYDPTEPWCEDGMFIKPGPQRTLFNSIIWIAALAWSFIGVAIAADQFMAAIEVITSQSVTKDVVLPDGHHKFVEVTIWNATVANLTLMALGSSAPEILLSCIEIVQGGFYAGELGPSTIVGSAAYNLLVITAVCVMAIPSGQGRLIKDLNVFYITAAASIFAYVWLLYILMISSPNIVDLWEGSITFMMFPVLVLISYLADIGFFSNKGAASSTVIDITHDGKPVVREDVSKILALDSVKALSDQPEQALKAVMTLLQPPQSKAHYRRSAIHDATGAKSIATEQEKLRTKLLGNVEGGAGQAQPPATTLAFSAAGVAVHESDKCVVVEVVRSGEIESTVKVAYETVAGTATADADYVSVSGVLTLKPGQASATISVEILDDDEEEDDETFKVVLSSPQNCALGRQAEIEVTIIDDDGPGELFLASREVEVTEGDGSVQMVVERTRGIQGTVGAKWKTHNGTAFDNKNFRGGEGNVTFPPGVMRQIISIPIVDVGIYEGSLDLALILTDAYGGAKIIDNGKSKHQRSSTSASVRILPDPRRQKEVDSMAQELEMAGGGGGDVDLAQDSWCAQFSEALTFEGTTAFSFMMFVIALPWKLLGALTPPPALGGGWLCFIVSLAMIGMLTALISDIASQMGCCLGLMPSVTAITFVALGTSMPDTFASKTAAENEPFADASIVNITGSNSVNVFLGLGMPWFFAALYWSTSGAKEEGAWRTRYEAEPWYRPDMPVGFAVPAGDLGFSVGVFSGCAVLCIAGLMLRRSLYGFELGGPSLPKYVTAFFFVGLWVTYITLSSMSSYGLLEM